MTDYRAFNPGDRVLYVGSVQSFCGLSGVVTYRFGNSVTVSWNGLNGAYADVPAESLIHASVAAAPTTIQETPVATDTTQSTQQHTILVRDLKPGDEFELTVKAKVNDNGVVAVGCKRFTMDEITDVVSTVTVTRPALTIQPGELYAGKFDGDPAIFSVYAHTVGINYLETRAGRPRADRWSDPQSFIRVVSDGRITDLVKIRNADGTNANEI